MTQARITHVALCPDDLAWYEVSIIQRAKVGGGHVRVEWLEGPRHERRDVLPTSHVRDEGREVRA